MKSKQTKNTAGKTAAGKSAAPETDDLLRVLKERFEKNMHRHKVIKWETVLSRLEGNKKAINSLYEMERTGGEPDVVGIDKKTGAVIFCDCSEETPAGRRSLCYDREALDKRKEHKPKNSACDMAREMGIEMLTEDEYRALQETGGFDLKTSSWVNTPPEVRKLGGAIFCDRRFDRVFTYHNGAESYYAARGFRGKLLV